MTAFNRLQQTEPLMHPRPALWAAAGSLCACLVFAFLPAFARLTLAVIALAAGVFLFIRQRALFALPLFFGLLLIRCACIPGALPSGTAEITGRVQSAVKKTRAGAEVTLGRLYIHGEREAGTLVLQLPEALSLSLGDTVTAEVKLTPAEWDSSQSRGTAVCTGAVSVTEYSGFSPYITALRWREELEETVTALYAPYAGEANGMLLGDRSAMSYTSYAAYKRSGLMHLLCVSGLHVGVVAGAVLFLLRGKRRLPRFLAAAAFLLLYTALTGFSVSSLRAALMLLLTTLTTQLGRQKDTLSALSLSFSLLLLVNPAYLDDLGFQLSFSSVLGLCCLTRPLTAALPQRCRRFAAPFAASLAACIGTAPLLCRASGQLEWAGLLLSPVAIPVTPFFLIPGWLSLLFTPVSPALGYVFSLPARGVLIFLQYLTTLGSFHALSMPVPGAGVLALWYAALLLLSPYFLPNGKHTPYPGYAVMGAALGLWLAGC